MGVAPKSSKLNHCDIENGDHSGSAHLPAPKRLVVQKRIAPILAPKNAG